MEFYVPLLAADMNEVFDFVGFHRWNCRIVERKSSTRIEASPSSYLLRCLCGACKCWILCVWAHLLLFVRCTWNSCVGFVPSTAFVHIAAFNFPQVLQKWNIFTQIIDLLLYCTHSLLSVLYQLFFAAHCSSCFALVLFFCKCFPFVVSLFHRFHSFTRSFPGCMCHFFSLRMCSHSDCKRWMSWTYRRVKKNRTCYEFTWELKCIQNNCLSMKMRIVL